MRVLFLDIDGVLNSRDYFLRVPQEERIGNWPENTLDPRAVRLLSDFLTETGLQVVLSSTWRKTRPLSVITEHLRFRGFQHTLMSKTPAINWPGPDRSQNERGNEILTWLRENSHRGITDWIIFDDDGDLKPFLHRWIKVSNTTGLTTEHLEQARTLLAGV